MTALRERLTVWLRATTPADADLLGRFAADRDKSAFATLVEKHGRLVLGVCRRVAGPADADDVFQAVFLTLARNAARLRRPAALPAWLHATAYRLSLNARRARHRRAAAESRAEVRSTADPLDELSARELVAILDAEIERLPEADRGPLILCCLDGLSLDEAAARLGVSAGAVRGRLERSRSRLRRNLAKRGVTVSMALGAGLLLTPPAVARPLIDATVSLGLGASPASAAVTALLTVAPRPRIWAALLIGMMGIGVGLMAFVKSLSPQPPPANAPAPPAPRVDNHGDPLPPGVVARLGVPRLTLGTPMAFAPDGRSFVGVNGEVLFRFDATTGKLNEQKSFAGVSGYSALSADGRIGAAFERTRIKAWELSTGRFVIDVPAPSDSYTGTLSQDGKKIATLATVHGPIATYRLAIWDVATSTERVLEPTKANGYYLLFSPDAKRLLVWHSGRELTCWDVARGQSEWTVKGQSDKALFAPDGRTVFRHRSGPGWVALDAATGKTAAGFKLPFEAPYSDALVAPDNRTFLLPTERGLTSWDMKEGREIRLIPGTERDTMWGARFVGPIAPDGKSVLTNFGALQRYDLATGQPLLPDTTGLGHTTPPSSFAFSPDGKWLASGSWNEYTVRVWETATGRLAHTLRGHTSGLRKIQFTPDSTRLVSGSSDSTVRVWDTASGRELHVLRLHDGRNRDEFQQVTTLRISSDGRRVTVIAREGWDSKEKCVASVWDIVDGKRLDQRQKAYPTGDDSMWHRQLTAEGAILMEYGRLIDAAGKQVRPDPLLGADERLAFGGPTITADGHLAAGPVKLRSDRSEGNTVLVWETATGRAVVRLPITITQHIAFDSTGTRLVTISQSGVQTWDLRTGRAVRTHPAGIPDKGYFTFVLTVAPDGRTAATGQQDGTILLWDVAPPKSVAAPLTVTDCAAAWAELASPDAAKGFAAVCRLADDPKQSLPFLKEHLRPVASPPEAEVRALVNDLGSPQFKTRDAAEKALRVHGDRVEPLLRDALKANPPGEVKKRIDAILAGFAPSVPPEGETLRGIRAVWALERIGTRDARRLLEELANGVETARLTRDAKAALEQLTK